MTQTMKRTLLRAAGSLLDAFDDIDSELLVPVSRSRSNRIGRTLL